MGARAILPLVFAVKAVRNITDPRLGVSSPFTRVKCVCSDGYLWFALFSMCNSEFIL